MNNDFNNIDDLFDDKIDASLRKLGFIFPRTVEDFNAIEGQLKIEPLAKSERMSNPVLFLQQRRFVAPSCRDNGQQLEEYSRELSQAAREGKSIPDDIRQKMASDKRNATNAKACN